MSVAARPLAAVYIRVSKDSQEENTSLESQEAACRAYAAERGYRVADVYRDVHTGYELWERPQARAMLDAIRRRELQAIVCLDPDRLTRKQVHMGILLDECERAGVELQFVLVEFDKTPEGELLRNVRAYVAELEREKIKERTGRGLLARVQAGKPTGGGFAVFGYRWRDEGHTGYVVDEATAPIVRRMFAMAAAGRSLRAIADTLNAEGIPTPRGKAAWSHTSVLKILRHEGYVGALRAHRTERRRVAGKIVVVRRPAAEQIALPAGTMPALIDPATFARVQERLDRNKAEATRNSAEPERFLLRAGHVVCGYCGQVASARLARQRNGSRFAFYTVGDGASHRACGHRFAISAAELDAAALDYIERRLANRELIAREIERLRAGDPTEADLAAVDRALVDISRRQANLARGLALLDDPEAAAPLVRELNALGERKRQCLDERATILSQRAGWQAALDHLDSLEGWCRTVRENLRDGTYAQQREALDVFGVRVQLYRRDRTPRWAFRATLDLAELLATPLVDTPPARSVHNARLVLRWTSEDAAAAD